MRFIYSSLLIAMMAMVATSASALTAHLSNVLGGSSCVEGNIVASCTLELDLQLLNAAHDGVASLGISIVAYDEFNAVVDFNSIATLSTFVTGGALLQDPGTFTPGLTNGGGFIGIDATSGLNVLRAVQAVATANSIGDGTADVVAGGNGGQMSVILTMTGLVGDYTLIATQVFGDSSAGLGGVPVPFNSSGVIDISNPIPEPGTALLMGLGLAGLAGAGRRKA